MGATGELAPLDTLADGQPLDQPLHRGWTQHRAIKTEVLMDEARRLRYLAAMGIRVWQPRSPGETSAALEQAAALEPDQRADQQAEQRVEQPRQQRPRPAPTAQPTTTSGGSGAQAALQAIARATSARRAQAEASAAKPATQPAGAPASAASAAPASVPVSGQASAESPQAPTDRSAAPPDQRMQPAPTHADAYYPTHDRQEPPPWLDEAPPWSDEDEPPFAAEPDHQQRQAAPDPVPTADAGADQPEIARMDWDALAASVAECRRCPLCETRTNTVFGTGNRNAELMFVGEGPGQDEDQQGEPFVGRAGQLLNKMLAAVGLAREQVYIANIVKCRPPRNRNPAPDEAMACRPYLERQIALIRPKLVVSLGAVSANNLLGNTDAVGRLRGRTHQYRPNDGANPIPLMVTYHPSYYLRAPAEKAKGWQDLQRIIKALRDLP